MRNLQENIFFLKTEKKCAFLNLTCHCLLSFEKKVCGLWLITQRKAYRMRHIYTQTKIDAQIPPHRFSYNLHLLAP